MRKFLASILAVASIFTASAEGYQVNTLSARQIGMGHTGTALKLNSESMIFNPAGMAFMDKTIDFTGSFTAIFATADATVNGSKYTTDNTPSTPMSVNLGFSIYDNLKAGISFYTPYGSNINWTENWPGATLNQSCKLQAFTLQPTVAWKITDKLSIGAGLMMTWGNVDLNKGLVDGVTIDQLIAAMMPNAGIGFGSTTPASINLNGSASVAFGVNAGAMYQINDKWTVGASYRSKMNMKVKAGTASVTFVNELAKQLLENQLNILDQANFKAQMPCVAILNIGGSYKPIDRLTIAADIQLSFWNAYKQLDIEFLSEQLTPYNQNLVKNYKNSLTYHLGAQFALTQRFDIRAGIMVDTPPMRRDIYNPETPGMTKIEPSCGVSFRPIKNLSIDFSFLYVAGLGRDNASCDYKNLVTGQNRQFTADYNAHAVIPSLGIGFNF